jgi:hypothetical protein
LSSRSSSGTGVRAIACNRWVVPVVGSCRTSSSIGRCRVTRVIACRSLPTRTDEFCGCLAWQWRNSAASGRLKMACYSWSYGSLDEFDL